MIVDMKEKEKYPIAMFVLDPNIFDIFYIPCSIAIKPMCTKTAYVSFDLR